MATDSLIDAENAVMTTFDFLSTGNVVDDDDDLRLVSMVWTCESMSLYCTILHHVEVTYLLVPLTMLIMSS